MSAAEFFGADLDFGDQPSLRMDDSSNVRSLIPRPIQPNVQSALITAPLADFRSTNDGSSKSELIIKYLKDIPETSPNSRKISAALIWLYFATGTGNESKMIYLQDKGWYVYDKFWKSQGDEMIDIVILLQTEFLTCLQQARAIVSVRNVFKNLATGDMHPRKKHLIDLEIDISSATRCAALIFELRPYFLRTRPMGENPYILQLQNATVDLETNTIRRTSPFDYASKQSLIRVPDYALPGASDLREPAEAEKDRRWILDFVWSIFRPDTKGKPHELDAHHILGAQGKTNSYFFLFLLARLLHGVPIKKTIFSFPQGVGIRKSR